jgi:hydroxymethylbilane synthase
VREEGGPDATVLALAGLTRLGLAGEVTGILPLSVVLPAPAQGAIGVEARADDDRTLRLLRPLDDAEARRAVRAERAFLRRLEGGCSIPAGALAQARPGGTLHLEGVLADPDGRELIRLSEEGPAEAPEALGVALADRIAAAGGGALLARLREAAP